MDTMDSITHHFGGINYVVGLHHHSESKPTISGERITRNLSLLINVKSVLLGHSYLSI